MEIIVLTKDHPTSYFLGVADLHIGEIHHGALPMLGRELLARLYCELAGSQQSKIWAAIVSDKVVGFLAGTANIRESYVTILSRIWPALLSLGLPLLKLSLLRRFLALVFYPFQHSTLTEHAIEGCNNVHAEILSIAVGPTVQRQGLGQILIKKFEQELWRCNVRGYYKTATNLVEVNSNAFYQKVGFIPCHQVKHNDLTLQVYLKLLSPEKESVNPDGNYDQ